MVVPLRIAVLLRARSVPLGGSLPHSERGQQRDGHGVEGPAPAAAPLRTVPGGVLGRPGGRCRLGAHASAKQRGRWMFESGVSHRINLPNNS